MRILTRKFLTKVDLLPTFNDGIDIADMGSNILRYLRIIMQLFIGQAAVLNPYNLLPIYVLA